MRKPAYYIWRDDCSTQEEYENLKERYTKMGFRVVTFRDGQGGRGMEEDAGNEARPAVCHSCGTGCTPGEDAAL